MDLLPLILPSILFGVLQYQYTVHVSELKSHQKNVSRSWRGKDAEIKKLKPNDNARATKTKDKVNAFLTSKSTSANKFIIFTFILYLFVLAVAYGANSIWEIDPNCNLFYILEFPVTINIIISVLMFVPMLGFATQIYRIVKSQVKINGQNNSIEEGIAIIDSLI